MAKILVVDDSDSVRSQLKKEIEQAGHVVVTAVDGVDGLAKLKDPEAFQLILSDVNMPNMDGLTMCQGIRKLDQYQSTPIMMLTTENNEQMKTVAKDIGIRAWVRKPYVAAKLLAAIQTLLK